MDTIIIDDFKANCLMIESLLDTWGYSSESFTDPQLGLKRLENLTAPTVLILDWVMPDISGPEICRRVRNRPRTQPLYIILLTSKSAKEELVEGLESGADDYITKPFDEGELISRFNAGVRIINLENKMLKQNEELKKMLTVIHEDEQAARVVQRKMLPPPEEIIGQYRFTHVLHPSLYLSGDFLDYFELSDRWLGFYFADVAGHGASSSFITVLLRSFVSHLISQYRTGLNEDILDPKGVLDALNRELIAQELGKHLVIFFGLIDRQENSLFYANGGQFPRAILSRQDENDFVPGKGMLVGLFPQASYSCSGFPLPEDFSLYLFSDGALELYETDLLEEQLESLLAMTKQPHTPIEELQERLGLGNRTDLPDDVSILHIERGGS